MKGTIKSKDQITALFNYGEKFSAACVMALYTPTHASEHDVEKALGSFRVCHQEQAGETRSTGRVAYIAGKKLGAAPLRSRAKRRLREAAAKQGAPWAGYDVVLVARKGTLDREFNAIEADIARLARKLASASSDSSEKNPNSSPCSCKTSHNGSTDGTDGTTPLSTGIFGGIRNIPKNSALFCIKMYRHAISPLFPPSCRYVPTCSEYAMEAIRMHGFLRGCGLALRRIGRCHPLHEGGYDPVPLELGSKKKNIPVI